MYLIEFRGTNDQIKQLNNVTRKEKEMQTIRQSLAKGARQGNFLK